MSLEITELFQGDRTKRLVISYKEGSDFDLVLQQLQQNRQASKTNKGVSELIRTLVVATYGCEVFQHHPEVDSHQYERFCLEALGIISGYREVVKGYLSLLGAKVKSDEPRPTELDEPTSEKPAAQKSDDDLSTQQPKKLKKLSFIDSLLPK